MEITNDVPVEAHDAAAQPELRQTAEMTPGQVQTAPDVTAESVSQAAMPQIRISAEVILYAALILLALVLRVPDLSTIPLGDREAHEALAAFRAVTTPTEDQPLVAHSPLNFTATVLLMSTGATDTGTARLPTAIVGVLLVLSPLLFRRWIGPAKALIASVLLTISPIMLLSSRSMGGSVWAIALALLAIYFIGRYVESRNVNYALAASASLALVVLMCEPAGFVTALGLGAGILFAVSGRDLPFYRSKLSETLRDWPWLRSLIAAGVVVGLTGTVFMLYPRGLSGIGLVVGQSLQGFISRPAGYPFVFPLLASLLYEPVLWVFGLVGAYLVLSGAADDADEVTIFMRRLMLGWLGFSFIAALVYQGAEPYNALWFTIPLVGLSIGVVEKALAPVRDRLWDVPTWGPYLHAIGVVAMLSITGINMVLVARMFQGATPDALPNLDPTQRVRLIFIIPSIMLIVITFFLVGSIWGARAPWHGLGMGVLIFLGIYSLGSGWRAAVINADDPREFWQVHPAARNLSLLETTLTTASGRVTGTPYDMPLDVVIGPDGLTSDSALGWALRRFHHAQFVAALAPTTDVPVIIQAQQLPQPKVAAAYVGQRFPLYYTWDRGTLSWDILSWLYDRQTRVAPTADNYIIAWVRSDVYGVSAPDSSLAPAPSTDSAK